MAEFRYKGVTVAGKPAQGTLTASSQYDAKQKIKALAAARGLRVHELQKKTAFSYKVRKADKGIQKGEVLAFSRDEVRDSLLRMGYQILEVRRQLFRLRMPVPIKEVVVFIRLCADLLKEQFPFDEILSMLVNDMENRRLRETVQEIHKDLKMGKEGHQVFLKHADVLGKFTVHMLSIASTSGNMAEIYLNTAKFLERSEEFKKNIRSTLFMPAIVMLAAFGALIFYVSYIFPKVAGMLIKYKVAVPPMTAATLQLSNFLKDTYGWFLAAMVIALTGFIAFIRSESGRVKWDRFIITIPVVGNLIYKTSIEVFCRVFHALYSGSGENIEVIRIAAEASGNSYVEKIVKERVVPTMLREGKSFNDVLEQTGVFPQNAIYTLRTGEESGTLREAMLRLANFYEKETTHKMARVIDLINLIISVFISVLIVGITLLSSEVGFVSPPTPMGK